MSEQLLNQLSIQNKKRETITSDFLKTEDDRHIPKSIFNIKKLTRIFSKVEIEKSKYYAYRMNKYLEIPLDAVYKDQSIIKLTQNKAIINESLSKVPSVTILNERKIIVLNYSFNRNELFVPQKQLVEKDKDIVSLKEHHVSILISNNALNQNIFPFQIKKEVKKIIYKGNTFIISFETRESVQSAKNKLLQQDIKAYDEREKFYNDLIENIEKQKSIPTISDKSLRQIKPKENFIGYHKGIIQGFISQTMPPVSPSTSLLNPIQFMQIMDPNFLRRNTVMDSIQYPLQNQNNLQRKKNSKPQIETPKLACATPQFRRKRLLSQGHNNEDQLVFEYDSTQNKNQSKNSGMNEEIIYEKKKNTSIQSLKSPKQVQFKDENLQYKLQKIKSKVQSTSQFEKADLDKSDQMSNESSDFYKKNYNKLKTSKSSELFKDNMHYGDKTYDNQRESLHSEDANTASTQQIETSEYNFTPKITLLQMEINQNQEDSESDQEEDINEKEKFHPQTTDAFRPNTYHKLEQIDDLEI